MSSIQKLIRHENGSSSLEDKVRLCVNPQAAGENLLLAHADYTVPALLRNPWLTRNEAYDTTDIDEARDSYSLFPAEGTTFQKRVWCVDNGYAYLKGGWNKNTLGQLVLTRLDSGIEDSLHDATQWLEAFQVPEHAYDIAGIKKRIAAGEQVVFDDEEEVRLHSAGLEKALLSDIIHAPQNLRDRLLLPRKKQRVQQLFFQPEHQLLYQLIGEQYKKEDFSATTLRRLVDDAVDTFYDESLVNAHNKDTTLRISREEFTEKVHEALNSVCSLRSTRGDNITGLIQKLNQYGVARKKYIDDASTWLVKHSVAPNGLLTKVWGDRAAALCGGAHDSAREIEKWQKDNALWEYMRKLERSRDMPHNLSAKEAVTHYKDWLEELSRCYSSKDTVREISRYKGYRNMEAVMPPDAMKVQSERGDYTAEVLAKDDPRGTTIGYDTGCCMTLRGASYSCIKSGYEDKNAGLFALYTPEGKLAAQSYFYVNPRHPDTLVLDNIEANRGRDVDNIVSIYESALRTYVQRRLASDSDWKITKVHVGTGYGQEVKKTLLKRQKSPIVHNPNASVYTDADEDQRLLFAMTPEEIAEHGGELRRVETPEAVKPRHEMSFMLRPMTERYATVLANLEAQIYQEEMRLYGEDAQEEIEGVFMHSGAAEFSFFLDGVKDARIEPIGYCIAYFDDSEDPSYDDKVLYIDDVAVLPEYQGQGAGSKMFKELFSRVLARDLPRVEMSAREMTSYPLLMRNETKQFLYEHGYKITTYADGNIEYDNGELGVFLVIEKLDQ